MAVSEQIIHETDTELEHYAVVDRIYEGRPARVLFSGPRRAAQSGIGLDDDPDLLFDYNQRLLEVASGLYPKRILVIGGGAFTLPLALLTALPNAMIDVVELDAGLLPIAKQYFGLQPNDRLGLYFGDGRDFIANTKNSYDLIILDVFSELAIPQQFLTLDFIKQTYALLSDAGCVAFNIIATYKGKNRGLISGQVAAYQSLYAKVTVFPAAYGLSGWLPQNLLLIAQKFAMYDFNTYVRYAAIDNIEIDPQDIRYDPV